MGLPFWMWTVTSNDQNATLNLRKHGIWGSYNGDIMVTSTDITLW